MSEDEWDRSIYTQDYVIAGYTYLVTILLVVIIGIFMRKLSLHKKTQTQMDQQTQTRHDIKAVTRATIAAIVIYLASATFLSLSMTKWIFIVKEHGQKVNSLEVIGGVLYAFNFLCLLVFILLQRLNIISPRKYKYIKTVSYTVPVVIFIVTAAGTVSLAMLVEVRYGSVFGSIMLFISMVMYCIILVKYFNTISTVMKYRLISKVTSKDLESNTHHKAAETMPSLHNETERDDIIVNFKTLEDAVRYSVLVLLCTVTMFLTPIFSVIGTATARHETHHNTLNLFALMTDIIANTICLCLMFRFMDSYYRNLCGAFDRCILSCCMARNYRNSNENSNLTYDQYKALIVEP